MEKRETLVKELESASSRHNEALQKLRDHDRAPVNEARENFINAREAYRELLKSSASGSYSSTDVYPISISDWPWTTLSSPGWPMLNKRF
tara:strand:- start:225 stop:494 length:270 start_codon:yes stop_codon:yes gene_type:complete